MPLLAKHMLLTEGLLTASEAFMHRQSCCITEPNLQRELSRNNGGEEEGRPQQLVHGKPDERACNPTHIFVGAFTDDKALPQASAMYCMLGQHDRCDMLGWLRMML